MTRPALTFELAGVYFPILVSTITRGQLFCSRKRTSRSPANKQFTLFRVVWFLFLF
jgi:hypothetical protein